MSLLRTPLLRVALCAVCILAATNLAIAPGAATGAPAPRIINGEQLKQDAYAARWPFLVALFVDRSGPTCGGTLVGRATVVTAAHCIVGTDLAGPALAPSRLTVLSGSTNVAKATRIDVKRVVKLPAWSATTGTGDVAVLQLAEPALGRPISPVTSAEPSLFAAGVVARAAGWGLTVPNDEDSWSSIALETALPIASDEACADNEAPGIGDSFAADAMLCAGSPGVTDTCSGDSGGPLVVTDAAGATRLAGVVSFGAEGACAGSMFGVYARASTYATWIAAQHSRLDAVPSTPRNAKLKLVRGALRISWSAATDDVKVTGYDVLQRTGKTWKKVGSTNRTSVTRPLRRAGTYQFAIVARDAQGHTSLKGLTPTLRLVS